MPKQLHPVDNPIFLWMRPFFIIISILLAVVAIELGILLNGLSGTESSTTEMMGLTRDMNASTSKTMAHLDTLMQGVTPEDVKQIVYYTKRALAGASDIFGSVSESGNISSVVAGVQRVVLAINVTEVSTVIHDIADIMEKTDSAVGGVDLSAVVSRASDVVMRLNPVAIQAMIQDIHNVTAETRQIVHSMALSHKVEVSF